jgi:hypothetical protein
MQHVRAAVVAILLGALALGGALRCGSSDEETQTVADPRAGSRSAWFRSASSTSTRRR